METPGRVEFGDLVMRLEHFGIVEVPGRVDSVVVLVRMDDRGIGPHYTMQRIPDDQPVHPRIVSAILRRFGIDDDDWGRSALFGPRTAT